MNPQLPKVKPVKMELVQKYQKYNCYMTVSQWSNWKLHLKAYLSWTKGNWNLKAIVKDIVVKYY